MAIINHKKNGAVIVAVVVSGVEVVAGVVVAHTDGGTRTDFRITAPADGGTYTITAVFTIDDGQQLTRTANLWVV